MRGFLVLVLVFSTGCGAAMLRDGPEVVESNGVVIDRGELEARIHTLVNRQRAQHGLSQLSWNEAIRPIARGHSNHMGRRRYFSHNAPNGADFSDRYRRARFRCQVPAGGNRILLGGENLFMGHVVRTWTVYSDGTRQVAARHNLDSLAQAAVVGWMNSRSHRENLLTPHWRTEAIGVEITEDGRVYATQNFC